MKNEIILSQKEIESRIFHIRGVQVMLDNDLAEMYQVETRVLNQAVKRNIERFPEDFMFQLTKIEWNNLISQNVMSSEHGGRRTRPFAFTEQGVSGLSGVLKSQTAAKMQVAIMRTFVQMRKIIRLAKKNIVLIDNYIDENTLTHLSKKNKNVNVLLLTKSISKQLKLDLKEANEQYANFEVKTFTKSHHRFLIIDQKEVYHLGASLKDLGKKWFAFSKMDENSVESILKGISD